MKVFISQPMRGRSDEEILAERNQIIEDVRRDYPFLEVLDSFFGDSDMSRALEYLGESIKLLAQADLAVFAPGWQEARGCRIEYECCKQYGIEVVEWKRHSTCLDAKEIIVSGPGNEVIAVIAGNKIIEKAGYQVTLNNV